KVWFNDDTTVTIHTTDPNSATSNIVSVTLENKYKYQLKKSDGTTVAALRTVDSGESLTFDAAKTFVGPDLTGRAVVAFKNTAGNIVLREAADPGPTSITFNDTNFSNREISLTAVPKFTYSVKDGDDAPLSQNGTQEDPYILKFNGTAAEKTLHVSVPTSEYYGQITTTFETPNILTVNAGTIGIADTLTVGAIPPDPVKVTLKDSGTNGTGATQDFYVKIQLQAPAGFVYVGGNGGTVPNLYICDHEVTQGEYETYCGYGSTTNQPSEQYGVGTNYPAYFVSWYDALVYCNLRSRAEGLQEYYIINGQTDPNQWPDKGTGSNDKLCGTSNSNSAWNDVSVNTSANGYRLPTEAEWEWAANGGVSPAPYTYAGSNTIGAVAWYDQNSGDNEGPFDQNGKTHEIKGKTPNTLGIYDMSGNVWEWCWDKYSSSSSLRIRRGGSWLSDASNCAVSYRKDDDPFARIKILGFRVVRKAP
ncbi:MAG: SUMF1/EgtB/PvdO family nonheme iron enzyme, partial [Spirochaetaceae bacterium]|nr:SUMF1/EgtB/PvdO family nonheme iron enzyme [Spirochaetaceae bacterium]